MPGSAAPEIDHLVNIDRYPLERPGSADWWASVSHARASLRDGGCCVLPDFVAPDVVPVLRAECAGVAPLANYRTETVNAYNISLDRPLPAGHPGRIRMRRGNAFVPRDRIAADTVIHRLYSSPVLQRFVADCFRLPRLYELADPLAGLVLNVVRPGDAHPWHFDTNEFTVTLLTQGAEEGGVFEFCPDIRSAAEENFADVRAVLTGSGRHLVRRLTLRPGDLQLFRGRYALHRVTPVAGPAARHAAILAYTDRPGVLGSVERTRQLFGRLSPLHRAGEARASRLDQLLD
ncbi:MAG TPA: arpA protein [Pseudonocardia sp.]